MSVINEESLHSMDKAEKAAIENRKNQIISLIREFCSERLDDDYFELSVRLVDKLGRKRNVPFMSGKIEIWAAAVIHALGSINFLFDKSFQPYVTVEEINDFFGTNKSSSTGKSKVIRDLLNLAYFDAEFSTSRSKENNPFDRMMMVNGFITFKKPTELRPSEPLITAQKIELKIPPKKTRKPLPESTDMDLFAEIE